MTERHTTAAYGVPGIRMLDGLVAAASVGSAAAQPPGLRVYEGQPGNQGG